MLEIPAFKACREDNFPATWRALLVTAVAGLAFSTVAHSGTDLYAGENFKAAVSAKVVGFAVTASGAGSAGQADNNDSNEGEIAFEPQLDLTYDLGDSGTIYSRWSYVAAASWTFGDDPAPYGYVADGDHRFINEWGNLGWRNDSLDISFGAQDFIVGDALLIGDGSLDCGSAPSPTGNFCGRNSGEFFIGAHKAFRNSFLVRINQLPQLEDVRADIFWLQAGSDFYKGRGSEVWGVNLEYAVPEEGLGFLTSGTLGAMYIEVTSASGPFSASRDGRLYYDLRLEAWKFAALPDTTFYGELILNGGDNGLQGAARQDFDDAYAYYAEVEHNLQGLPWSPQVGYRYYRGSGDDPNTPNQNEAFDALFYTLDRGWGTWFQGEFAGEWWHNNSNQRTQMVKLVVTPPVSWLSSVKLLGFHHERDAAVPGVHESGATFANEVNLLLEYWNDSGFYIAGVFAHGDVGVAGQAELSNSNEDFNSAYVWVQQTF